MNVILDENFFFKLCEYILKEKEFKIISAAWISITECELYLKFLLIIKQEVVIIHKNTQIDILYFCLTQVFGGCKLMSDGARVAGVCSVRVAERKLRFFLRWKQSVCCGQSSFSGFKWLIWDVSEQTWLPAALSLISSQ